MPGSYASGVYEVYPRVCGGTLARTLQGRAFVGLSPRVRGNPGGFATHNMPGGSIPACAGEPRGAVPAVAAAEVYPRVCGGTGFHIPLNDPGQGLSPRVRGNLLARHFSVGQDRSIPACAGEPPTATAPSIIIWVYPRVCGGTPSGHRLRANRSGLSPRVRGNQPGGAAGRRKPRSIPARAGEPIALVHAVHSPRVYPRVCGGTLPASWRPWRTKGLSPRVRGNRCRWRPGARQGRSIPACAGEPPAAPAYPPAQEVYPRVCGGTRPRPGKGCRCGGLSPRVRGNPHRYRPGGAHGRSIPACAGEPHGARASGRRIWVYPRVCGGTAVGQRRDFHPQGLSPRVRGNPAQMNPADGFVGSIPACAGEPPGAAVGISISKVYPRVCGGTGCLRRMCRDVRGLSPRVRGNRRRYRAPGRPQGSIPACAGEPILVDGEEM